MSSTSNKKGEIEWEASFINWEHIDVTEKEARR